MKICIGKREAKALCKVMDNVKEGSAEEIREAFKNAKQTKALKINVNLSGDVEVEISDEYMAEFISVYGKYMSIIIPQIKALFETAKMFQEESFAVVNKYINA